MDSDEGLTRHTLGKNDLSAGTLVTANPPKVKKARSTKKVSSKRKKRYYDSDSDPDPFAAFA